MERRVKETEDEQFTTRAWEHTDDCWSTVDQSDSSPIQYLSSYDLHRTIGYDIENFHARRNRGELLPMTPFWQIQISGSTTGDRHTWGKGNYCGQDRYAFYAPYNDWLLTTEQVEAYASELSKELPYLVQVAAARIYSSGWDALTFAAELKKTALMFKGVVRRLVEYASSPKGLASAWLEARYGWRQLLFDIEDITKLLSSLDQSFTRYKETCQSSHHWTESYQYDRSNTYEDRTVSVTDTIQIGLRGRVIADISPPKVGLNPITTAWEIVPMSFVIDWVINVGQFLEACSFLALSTSHTAAGGYEVNVSREMLLTASAKSSSYYTTDTTQSGESTAILQCRIPQSVPTLPLLKLRLSELKVMDLISLLIQRL